MADPKKEHYTVCEKCVPGEAMLYHYTQLKLVKPGFWTDVTEEEWQCPNGHKVEPPPIHKKPAPPPPA